MRHRFVHARALAGALGAILALSATACKSSEGTPAYSLDEGDITESWSPDSLTEVRGIPVDDLRARIEERIASDDRPKGVDGRNWDRVRALYENYEHRPLWLEKDADSRRGDDLVYLLTSIHEHGLRGSAYPLEELRDALKPIDKAKKPTAEQLAEADVMLSTIYVALGEDLLIGQVSPKEVEPDWKIDPQGIDVDSALARTLRYEPLARAMTRLAPPDEGYRGLKEALKSYRSLAERGGWPTVPEGETLRPGDSASVERLTTLRKRLAAEGFLDVRASDTTPPPPAGGQAVFDRDLAGALARFQARHGIMVDSILGPGTTQSLNLGVEYRIGQIMANMERFRWLPREMGSRYVFVNVPAFQLHAYDEGQKVLDMKVIVGAEYDERATPAFADSMAYLEFAPYWNVPKGIAEKEIWPKQNADPSYFARNHYEQVTTSGGYTYVRQTPGPWNALGQVKFIFPNDMNIYLHDTPEDGLFERDVRAFSHGCIRVERPDALAAYALGNKKGWTDSRIRSAMNGENQRVYLDRKIPVYIVYFTAFHRDDVLHFGNDIYDRDDKLVETVKRSAIPSAAEVALLQELRKLVD